jgi:hypothetical protein
MLQKVSCGELEQEGVNNFSSKWLIREQILIGEFPQLNNLDRLDCCFEDALDNEKSDEAFILFILLAEIKDVSK